MPSQPSSNNEPLVSVTYISHSLIQDSEIQSQCNDIKRTASVNNAKNKVSGILLLCHQRFIQRLEGPKQAIDTLIEKIKTDPRHRNFCVLYYGTIRTRIFADWSHMEVVTEGAGFAELEQLLVNLETRSSMIADDKESRFIVNFIQHYPR